MRMVRERVWLTLRLIRAAMSMCGSAAQILSQAVVDNDGIVEGIAHQGQQGGHDIKVDLHAHKASSPTVINTSCSRPTTAPKQS